MSMRPRFLPYGRQSRVRAHPHNMPSTSDLVPEFLKENPGLTPPGNAMDFLSDDGGKTYNRCHCMSLLTVSRISRVCSHCRI